MSIETDNVRVQPLTALEALRQLYHECCEAGFKYARDYNWPKAMKDAEEVLARGEEGIHI